MGKTDQRSKERTRVHGKCGGRVAVVCRGGVGMMLSIRLEKFCGPILP